VPKTRNQFLLKMETSPSGSLLQEHQLALIFKVVNDSPYSDPCSFSQNCGLRKDE
jgi:hypothetical protein